MIKNPNAYRLIDSELGAFTVFKLQACSVKQLVFAKLLIGRKQRCF